MSVLQALSLAGGLGPTPAPQNARILRGGEPKRTEIAVNVNQILKRQAAGRGASCPTISSSFPPAPARKSPLRTLEAVIHDCTEDLILVRRVADLVEQEWINRSTSKFPGFPWLPSNGRNAGESTREFSGFACVVESDSHRKWTVCALMLGCGLARGFTCSRCRLTGHAPRIEVEPRNEYF